MCETGGDVGPFNRLIDRRDPQGTYMPVPWLTGLLTCFPSGPHLNKPTVLHLAQHRALLPEQCPFGVVGEFRC